MTALGDRRDARSAVVLSALRLVTAERALGTDEKAAGAVVAAEVDLELACRDLAQS